MLIKQRTNSVVPDYETKKQNILENAMNLMARNGLKKTSISEIAKVSGISAGAVYQYFLDKDDLINQLYSHLKAEMKTVVFQSQKQGDAYQDRFFDIWNQYFEYLMENPRKFLFLKQFSRETLPLEIETIRREFQETFEAFLKEGVEHGHLKPIEASIGFSFLRGMFFDLVQSQFSGAINLTPEDRKSVVQVCWDGLKK